MNKRLFYKDNLRYNVKRCIIFLWRRKFWALLPHYLERSNMFVHFVMSTILFSAMHARKLADKDGQIHCYYCRKVLQQLH